MLVRTSASQIQCILIHRKLKDSYFYLEESVDKKEHLNFGHSYIHFLQIGEDIDSIITLAGVRLSFLS